MLTNRYTKIFSGLLILMVAFVSVNIVAADISSKNGSGKNRAGSNTYLPLPPGKQTQLFNAARNDRLLNHGHRSQNRSASLSASYPDYFQRHPELSQPAVLGQGASDYAERHPELTARAASAADQTDYYFRHINK
jgi:hypothetical protein